MQTKPHKALSNPTRTKDYSFRFGFVTYVIIGAVRLPFKSHNEQLEYLLALVADICALVMIYLATCTPRPGSPYIASKWIDAIFLKPVSNSSDREISTPV